EHPALACHFPLLPPKEIAFCSVSHESYLILLMKSTYSSARVRKELRMRSGNCGNKCVLVLCSQCR
ncbi:hypothetical protein HispidOSU_023682, partial [Sigmodon hispidus]